MEGIIVSEDDESSQETPLSESKGGLKDTFWKDLEEGRVNLFDTDMYSRVKGGGRGPRQDNKKHSKEISFRCLRKSACKRAKCGLKENSLKESNKKKHSMGRQRSKKTSNRCIVKSETYIERDLEPHEAEDRLGDSSTHYSSYKGGQIDKVRIWSVIQICL